jgi:hypothetical protein
MRLDEKLYNKNGKLYTLYPQKLVLTTQTGGGHSVDIVHLRTKATEFSFSWKAVLQRTTCIQMYCNGFDQHVARQQLCKHGPTCNNRGSCFL